MFDISFHYNGEFYHFTDCDSFGIVYSNYLTLCWSTGVLRSFRLTDITDLHITMEG